MRKSLLVPLLVLAAGSTVCTGASAQPPGKGKLPDGRLPNPVPYASDEPRAKAFSLENSVTYLDTVAKFWTKDACGNCHANFTYFMARSLPREQADPAIQESRRFLEDRVAQIAKAPRDRSAIRIPSESVGIAAALAFHDAQTTGKLRPTTRQALGQMWLLQKKGAQHGPREGTWGCGCGDGPIAELDAYYAATVAALAVGIAPDGYAKAWDAADGFVRLRHPEAFVQEREAHDGLTRLRRYLANNPARSLHHRAMLLWASTHLDGLMTKAKQEETVQALLAHQRDDGGWSMGLLLESNDYYSSDGYGTGFVIYVLRQAGVPASRPALVRGIRWLERNQRASGGWFVRSDHAGHQPEAGHGTRELSLLNATASFAVMALRACEGTASGQEPWGPYPLGRHLPGLALRQRLID